MSEQQARRRLGSRLDALSQETRLVIKKKKKRFSFSFVVTNFELIL